MSVFPLAFTAPFVLLALAALPAIWLLLRVVPPTPQRIAFPPLRIFADLMARREVTARTPWWLLLIRLLTMAFLIVACAGPVWNPPAALPGHGPILLLVDNGFPAARTWQSRMQAMEETAGEALRNDRLFAIAGLADRPAVIELLPPDTAMAALRAMKPAPHLGDRSTHLNAIRSFLDAHPDASIQWLSDGVQGSENSDGEDFIENLATISRKHELTIVREDRADILALAPSATTGPDLTVRVLRPDASARSHALVRALDGSGRPVAEIPFDFSAGSAMADISLTLPTELRNTVSRIEIPGEKSAGAVLLVDERNRRRSVGIASGSSFDQSQPMLSPTYYLQRALQPYADIRMERSGNTDTVGSLIGQKVDVLILADTGVLDGETTGKLENFVEGGGLLIRFAGSRLASGDDTLLPVRLRRGDRDLGGALSWSTPKKLAEFPPDSPFSGLKATDEIVVNRQVLAEPGIEVSDRTWATLEDGTPLVTAARRGKGMIVLFHVTATPSWSNLPLSGLFMDMLRRTIRFSRTLAPDAQSATVSLLAPRLVLDGYGDFMSPSPTANAVPSDFKGRASADIPPGFFGPADGGIAVNALTAEDVLRRLDDTALDAKISALTRAGSIDLRMPLFLSALLLFLLDSLVMVHLAGGLAPGRLFRRNAAPTLLLLLAAFFLAGHEAGAQSRAGSEQPGIEQSALATRLAYVLSGDATIDATSRAGLEGLGQFLSFNTSFEPASPGAVDPEKDELAFYPLIYWPISPGQPLPSDRAIRNLNAFMKNGGTILFDTRDAFRNRPGMEETPETAYLRRLLAALDVPQLEPVPGDHVLTKTFYLLENFPGRYDTSPLWTEVSTPRQGDEESGPVRSGDGVSPVLVTGNDFAAAWAVGPRNETLFPVTGSDPRQREMAFRSGVNIVLYTLTGNYKSDQVHVEDLLKRLDRREGR